MNTEKKMLPKVPTRHVSIPDQRPLHQEHETDHLFIGKFEISKKPGFSSTTSWKDSSDLKHIRETSRKKCASVSSLSTGSKDSSESFNDLQTSRPNTEVFSSDVIRPFGMEGEARDESKKVLMQESIHSPKLPGLSVFADSETVGSGLNCVGTYDLSDLLDTQRSGFSDTNVMSPRTATQSTPRGHTKLARTIDKTDFAKTLVSVGNTSSS